MLNYNVKFANKYHADSFTIVKNMGMINSQSKETKLKIQLHLKFLFFVF